ncbi:hypothetical protein, partial [Turicimonas muris]|uniref:hypothetical protein n=1 Tax=Turicimonas muris TaxID=1796652 RepID=UPI0032B1E496
LPTNNCKQRANAGKSTALIEPWEPYFSAIILVGKKQPEFDGRPLFALFRICRMIFSRVIQ